MTESPGASPPESPDGSSPNAEVTQDERLLGLLAHLLGIFTSFIGPLVIWLVKKDESSFIDDQGREALNFQITVAIASFAAGSSMLCGIGFVLMPLVLVVNLVFCIIGCIEAQKGVRYRYPVTLRLVK